LATYLDPSKITWDAVRAYALPLYEIGGRYALVETAKEMIPANLPKLIAGYPTIHQPTLLVWCAEDSIVPAWVGHRLAHDLPNAARLSLINGCGHAPQEELPKATLALIRGFLP
jgi:pimeloyl-ACP methyl ester carboxylesterase